MPNATCAFSKLSLWPYPPVIPEPGDAFAAAFDKRGQIQLILAKNGLPTSDDIEAANELFSLIANPDVSNTIDFFPFLMRRCGPNINKRIRNLHMTIQDDHIRNDFSLALESYEPMAEMIAEFPRAESVFELYGNSLPPFASLWRDLLVMITNRTARGLNAEDDISISTYKYASIFIFANALSRSRFLKSLIEDRSPRNYDRKCRVEKLKRRLDKVCQYAIGISHLIQKAKQIFPIPHRWVMDTYTDTGECTFDLCSSAYDAVAHGLGVPLSPEIVARLDDRFPSIHGNWERRKTINACIHAELRIILHLGPPPAMADAVYPIGTSKRSCFCCTLWIKSHNHLFDTQWMTSGSDGKPYANWALPGAKCPYAIRADEKSLVDKAVIDAVSVRLADHLDWLSPGRKRISDEYVSSGDDSSNGEQGMPKWQLEVDDLGLRGLQLQ